MSGNRLFTTFVLFFAISFTYRFYGLMNNHPFWVDEFSTANQARLVVENGFKVFTNPNIFFEPHNALFHFLIAGLYKLFGQSEFITRVPSAFAGSIVPPLLFLIAYRFFNLNTGIIAGLLATTSYFQIVWSRQARSYAFLQLLIVLGLYFYLQVSKHNKKSPFYIIIFGVTVAIGLLIHSFFYIFLFSLGIHYAFTNANKVTSWIKKPSIYIVAIIILAFTYYSRFLSSVIALYTNGGIIKANNVWYYHSFLWREYGLLSYLAFIGILLGLQTHRRIVSLILLYMIVHLTFVNILFAPYTTRYLLPIWPFIIIGASYTLSTFSEIIAKKIRLSVPSASLLFSLLLSGVIIGNGYKFDVKPNLFYSVNHDFREIALIDYHQVYSLIKKKGELKKGQTAVIDTWSDRQNWYLRRNFQHSYLFRWINQPGLTNGIPRKTEFALNKEGEKIIPLSNQRFIGELADLKKAMSKYPKGFIFIDDETMPQDVIQYVKKNFKKELYLEHYPLDDNPYSIWPATLYSWGI